MVFFLVHKKNSINVYIYILSRRSYVHDKTPSGEWQSLPQFSNEMVYWILLGEFIHQYWCDWLCAIDLLEEKNDKIWYTFSSAVNSCCKGMECTSGILTCLCWWALLLFNVSKAIKSACKRCLGYWALHVLWPLWQ